MSTFLSELGGLTEGVGAEALAFAAGFAAARALAPAATTIEQDAWNAAPVRRLDPETAAEAAAENYATFDVMRDEASYSGFDASRFAYIYDVTLTAPGFGTLLNLLRRDFEQPINFEHGLRKAKLEPQWDAALANLRDVRLDPAVVATAIQRGVMDAPFSLPYNPQAAAGKVPAFPVSGIDTLNELKAHGYDAERARIATALVGLPASPDLAARMTFRNIIDYSDFIRAGLEGNTRGEWLPFLFDGFREILTASQYTELQLRGYYDRTTRLANTRKHGMSDEDSDWLYDVQGRGLNLHQAFIAERRGGVFEGPTTDIPAWAMFQLQRGNLRPEVYNLAWAGRESYPSAFFFRLLLTTGAMTAAEGEARFLELGWPADLAKQVADALAVTTGAVADPHVGKAQTQLWNTVHTSYKNGEITEQDATASLGAAGVSAAAAPAVLQVWNEERTVIRKQLTPAQIKKAWVEAVLNAATGVAWTRDDALAALIARGYSPSDAATFLEL